MSKLGKRLIKAAHEARAIARGEAAPASYRVHVPAEVNVQKIRKQLGLSQAAFSAKFGIPAGTLRDWEQHRRTPEGPARVLLMVIKENPEAVSRALVRATA
jgi:putative transcriptional regulator